MPPPNGVQSLQSDAGQLPPPTDAAAIAPNPNMQNLQLLPSQPQDLTDAKVMAKCGNEVILRGDCDVQIAEFLAKQKVQVPPDRLEEQYEVLRRPVLKQLIEQKLVYADVIKQVPAAGMTKIEGNINEQFDKQQLPDLMKTNNAKTRQELDDKLRERGSSIDRERRNYFERQLVMGWMGEKIKKDVEINLSEILGYYWQHIDDYKFPAQARWEELMVSFDKYPDKATAFGALAQMGNQVMQGAPLADVAKVGSQGPTASSGGSYDWTNQGSVSSKEIDQAIFNLPVGTLSQIIETTRGFHIIRVTERKAAGKKSFEDAQTGIKEQLKKENIKSQVDKYLSEVKKKTPVWTIYDGLPGGLEGPKQPEEHPNFE
jgi:parvulin-like peptidyl-prolyl isomerase